MVLSHGQWWCWSHGQHGVVFYSLQDLPSQKHRLLFIGMAAAHRQGEAGRKDGCSAPRKATPPASPPSNTSTPVWPILGNTNLKDHPGVTQLSPAGAYPGSSPLTGFLSLFCFQSMGGKRGRGWAMLCTCVLWHWTPLQTQACQATLVGAADAKLGADAIPATGLASRAKSNISPVKQDRLSPAPRPRLLTPLSSAVKMFSLFEFALLSW